MVYINLFRKKMATNCNGGEISTYSRRLLLKPQSNLNNLPIISSSSSDEESDDSVYVHPESRICIRYDFDKSNNQNNKTILPQQQQQKQLDNGLPLFSYLEKAKHTNNNNSKSNNSECIKNNGHTHKLEQNYETPLSPESQKKELCSYLQLMKPGETAKNDDIITYKNRRSNRVRNLNSNNKNEIKLNGIGNKYLPLPSTDKYSEFTDFAESMNDLINSYRKITINGIKDKLRLKMEQKPQQTKQKKYRFHNRFRTRRRLLLPKLNSLRSKNSLRHISLDKLILTKKKHKIKRKKIVHNRKNQENRILTNLDLDNNCIKCDILPELGKAGKENTQQSILEHNYAAQVELSKDEIIESELEAVPLDIKQVVPVQETDSKASLHRSLTQIISPKRKYYAPVTSDTKKLNHSIKISRSDGCVLKIIYQDFHLVIVQANSVAIWTQTALGNILGAQNMWIPNGKTQRLPLNSTYVQKQSTEMVIAGDNCVAYVELWMKEHKSDFRERPLADIFVTVYFWRIRQSGVDKKALQLESIQGLSKDVQYVVLRSTPKICVCWYSVPNNETKIRAYYLAADFQTVASISEIQPVNYYISTLHNIEDCDNLILGCGDNKITLWNVEYGYIVATVELLNIQPALSTQWIKSDRGFLFIVQECSEKELRLLAINGMNHSFKKLQSYLPPPGFDGLKGVFIENGLLIAYYSQGMVCWNAESGHLMVEDVSSEFSSYVPSQKHIILLNNEQIIVKHSLSHLISAEIYLNNS